MPEDSAVTCLRLLLTLMLQSLGRIELRIGLTVITLNVLCPTRHTVDELLTPVCHSRASRSLMAFINQSFCAFGQHWPSVSGAHPTVQPQYPAGGILASRTRYLPLRCLFYYRSAINWTRCRGIIDTVSALSLSLSQGLYSRTVWCA